jgi:4-hydroxy-3-methylbut-2-enyl diphosphate reductase
VDLFGSWLLVAGPRNSSNFNRLREVGEKSSLTSYLIEDGDDLNLSGYSEKTRVGVTAGTSAPEAMVQKIIERLCSCRTSTFNEMEGVCEMIRFRLPESL